jgi:hypothetical protein
MASAMDVGNPALFERLLKPHGGDPASIAAISRQLADDREVGETIPVSTASADIRIRTAIAPDPRAVGERTGRAGRAEAG